YLEAPLFYCGLPCLLLMPQVYGFLGKRVSIFFIVFLAIWFLPFIFPYFRYALWLFSGKYYRIYSFFVAFFVMFFSLQALELIVQRRKINIVVLIATVAGLFLSLYFPYFPDASP